MAFQFLLAAAFFVGSLILSARKVEQGQLDDKTIQTADYGAPRPHHYGTTEVKGGGTVIWAGNKGELIEKKKVEKKGGLFGLGATKITTYEYFADFAVGFGHGPAAAFLKLYAEDELIYDGETQGAPKLRFMGVDIPDVQSLVGANVGASVVGLSGGGTVRFYLGTDTQDPDPLIEKWEGVGNVPAFRGEVYAVVEGLPVKDYGNGIPELTARINWESTTPVWTNEVVPNGSGSGEWMLDPVRPVMWRMPSTGGGNITKRDRHTGEILLEFVLNTAGFDFDGPGDLSIRALIVPQTGDLIFLGTESVLGPDQWRLVAIDGESGRYLDSMAYNLDAFAQDGNLAGVPTGDMFLILSDADGGYPRSVGFKSDTQEFLGDLAELSDFATYAAGGTTRFAVDAENQRIWLQGVRGGNATLFQANQRTSAMKGVVETDLTADHGIPSGSYHTTYDIEREAVLLIGADKMYVIAPNSHDLLDTITLPVNFTSTQQSNNTAQRAVSGSVIVIGALSGGSLNNLVELNTTTGAVLQQYDLNAQGVSAVYWNTYDAEINAVWFSEGNPNYLQRLFLPTVSAGTATLSDIVEDICTRSGISASDLTLASLTDEVPGYWVIDNKSYRAQIEPLQQVFFFDLPSIDGKLVARKLERGVDITVADADLGFGDEGEDLPPRLLEERTDEAEIPRRILLEYKGLENDYETATQPWQRWQSLTEARGEEKLTVPMVLTDQVAAEVPVRAGGMAWLGRDENTIYLPPSYLRLTASDVLEVTKIDDGVSRTFQFRAEEVEIDPNWWIKAKGRRHDIGVHQPVVVPIPHEKDAVFIPYETESVLALLNIASMDGLADDDGGFYIAVAPRYPGPFTDWNGAVVFQESARLAALEEESLIGRAVTALGDPPMGDINIFDRGSVVDVFFPPDSVPEGAPEAEVLTGINFAVVGAEVIQYAVVTDLGNNLYRLSTLLRGRKGTDVFTTGHMSGEQVVLIDRELLAREGGLSDRNIEHVYQAVTIDTDLLSDPVKFTNLSTALIPWSVAHLAAVVAGGGDVDFTWLRRDRLSPEDDDFINVDLNEDSEAYELAILDGVGAEVRVISSSVESATYTAAEQGTDGIAPPFDANVYQLSATLSRGRAQPITVS